MTRDSFLIIYIGRHLMIAMCVCVSVRSNLIIVNSPIPIKFYIMGKCFTRQFEIHISMVKVTLRGQRLVGTLVAMFHLQ